MQKDLALPREKIEEFIQEIYQHYPRKMGKTLGVRKLKTHLRTEKDCREFAYALAKFVSYHKKKSTEPEFIPYFSSFVSSWLDWLDDDVGSNISLTKEELSYAARKILGYETL